MTCVQIVGTVAVNEVYFERFKVVQIQTYDFRMQHGYRMDMAWKRILHLKGEASGTIQHDMFPILKYPSIIDPNN